MIGSKAWELDTSLPADTILRNAMGKCDNGMLLLSYNAEGFLRCRGTLSNNKAVYLVDQFKVELLFNKELEDC